MPVCQLVEKTKFKILIYTFGFLMFGYQELSMLTCSTKSSRLMISKNKKKISKSETLGLALGLRLRLSIGLGLILDLEKKELSSLKKKRVPSQSCGLTERGLFDMSNQSRSLPPCED